MSLQPDSNQYRIETCTGPVELQSIRTLWVQWQMHPNADFDFFSTIVQSRPCVVNPVALVMHHNNVPVALCALRLERTPLQLSFGYFKYTHETLLQLTVIYGGLMGTWNDSSAEVLIRHLRKLMKSDHIDTVYLAAMSHEHPVYRAAHRLVPALLRDIVLKNNLHWWTDLDCSFEQFSKKSSAKHRSQLRNKERKLVETLATPLQVKIFQTTDDVALFCSLAESIAQKTYLRGFGEGFYDNQEMRNRLNLSARKQWMRGYVLYAGETPCTFWLGTLYNHVFYLDYTGFDAAFKEYAVGQILFVKMIENLCAAGSVTGLDFGFGDAEYKQRYGDRNWEETDLYLFNGTPLMLLSNLTRKTVAVARTATKKILKRFALFERIKKYWRQSAQKAATNFKHGEKGIE